LANIINGTDTGSGGLITTGDSSDELQIQTAETTALTITSGQQSAFIAGTAAAPAVTTTGDLNTGIFFPAGDAVGVATNGAEAARFNSSGNLVFPNGQGIDFSASAGGGASSSLLDDYEEGTWTPGVSFGGASAGVTFSASNSGRYTKIGRSVTVIGLLELTNKGSSTGDALITGLPFTVASGEPNYGGVAIGYVSSMTFADVPFGRTSAGSTNLALSETTNAGVATTITNSDFANNAALRFTCTYFV
jgi:hypothetical protein